MTGRYIARCTLNFLRLVPLMIKRGKWNQEIQASIADYVRINNKDIAIG